LSSCTVPAAGKPTFTLADNEMEMGVGIHGEPGRRARRPCDGRRPSQRRSSARVLAGTSPHSAGQPLLAPRQRLCGGTPLIELYIMGAPRRSAFSMLPAWQGRALSRRLLRDLARNGRMLDNGKRR